MHLPPNIMYDYLCLIFLVSFPELYGGVRKGRYDQLPRSQYILYMLDFSDWNLETWDTSSSAHPPPPPETRHILALALFLVVSSKCTKYSCSRTSQTAAEKSGFHHRTKNKLLFGYRPFYITHQRDRHLFHPVAIRAWICKRLRIDSASLCSLAGRYVK